MLSWASLLEFAAFVNRYVELGPEMMLLSGSPWGPTLATSDGIPSLIFDAPGAMPGSNVWAESDVLGRVEATIRAQAQ